MRNNYLLNERINNIFNAIIELHSFMYTSLPEAKKTIRIDGLEYCFDALSLCFYHHNLNDIQYRKLVSQLNHYYESHYSNEDNKERLERARLFHYLNCDKSCKYYNYTIKKELRPDFVLTGEKQIGIEVVELTTEYDKVYDKILKQARGSEKNAIQIYNIVKEKHGLKVNDYYYSTLSNTVYIGTKTKDITGNKERFARQIFNKYVKYQNDIKQFDDFIILCDAQQCIEVTSYEDIEDIISMLPNPIHSLNTLTIAFIWEHEQRSVVSTFVL